MRRTKEEAAETRKALLDAALKVFSKQGYAATKLEDIAQHAGVTRGAIYWHFGSKAELYNALVSETWKHIDQMIDRAVEEGGTAIEIIRRIMVGWITSFETDHELRAVTELAWFKTENVPELQEAYAFKAEGVREGIAATVEGLEYGIAAGEIRADLDPWDIARAIIAYQNGVVLIWLLDPTAFSLKERAADLADVFIRGILPRS
jgi:TetR/AcrR family transcriptional regulator, acrAB operon repressor